jgi:hypothetical protein
VDRITAIESAGLSLFPPEEFYAKNAAEGHPGPYALMDANGGVVCPWAGDSEVQFAYGYSPLSEGEVADAMALIVDTGDMYSDSAFDGGTLYTSEIDGNAFALFFITDTAWFVATDTVVLEEMRAIVP